MEVKNKNIGLDWIGLGWIGLDWVGLDRIGLAGAPGYEPIRYVVMDPCWFLSLDPITYYKYHLSLSSF